MMEKFRTDFRIDFPHINDDVEDDKDIDLAAYFDKAKLSIQDVSRWSIDTSSVVLGFFSYNKFLMWRDLDVKAWSEESGFLKSNTLHSLFGDGFDDPGPAIDDDVHVDRFVLPEDIHHVVDADSSQARGDT